ncbi:MAG TPA: molybdopterin-dependent oxidoreductase [Pyrinomonadaceae bacterium]|jgi:anaerobic selenocysteine-containing dehydrogenase|nr:molybdopterin-dependent oxidoreductase [Pyrinomonadaceae bacterium]
MNPDESNQLIGAAREETEARGETFYPGPSRSHLAAYPPKERWDNWTELDSQAWPRRKERHYSLVPTTCFNCESACGLLAYIDKITGEIQKFEGNPEHPGSRGRNCAKGPATLNQIHDPDRILYPLKRSGKRGQGKWERVSWDAALDDIASRIRKAIVEERRNEIMYHVGRPGEDGFTERILAAWGIDGHNSHTNICSSGSREGYQLWMGLDRPSPDHANAKVILLISAHLESGHYFNPHAQRIIDGKANGAKLIVFDTRLSHTATHADYWVAPYPGSEGAMLLAIANYLIQNDLYNREFVRRWWNWEEYLEQRSEVGQRSEAQPQSGEMFMEPDSLPQPSFRAEQNAERFAALGKDSNGNDAAINIPHLRREETGDTPAVPVKTDFATFEAALKETYQQYTFDFAASESGVDARTIEEIAKLIATAGTRFSSHNWRSVTSGVSGGWAVARAVFMLNALLGAIATEGGVFPNAWNKFVPKPIYTPPHPRMWNETQWPREYPLAMHEMSFLLPHLLKDGRAKLDVYFTRVYNPVWTNPDGFSWIEMLTDPDLVGCYVALTPTWNETSYFADYVLPMGHGSERHDIHSYETHDAQWLGFRQPVKKADRQREGETIDDTRKVNPGEVWEENEFWLELTWRIDPDGSLGIRQYVESKKNPGTRLGVDEYYEWIFDNSVPGLPEKAAAEGLTPLEFMRRYGAFEVKQKVGAIYEEPVGPEEIEDIREDERGRVYTRAPKPASPNVVPVPSPDGDGKEDGRRFVGVRVGNEIKRGFPTPSGRLEFYSRTLSEWGWHEFAIPTYIKSHVHPDNLEEGQTILISTFRLPVQIHTRSANAKWLDEIAHTNPLWIHTNHAAKLGVRTGDLLRVETEIGYYVVRAWVTEGIRPGIVACSHHMGRWKLSEQGQRQLMATVKLDHDGTEWGLKREKGAEPYESSDPDTLRIWWSDVGVHQNMTFPVHPDPISGMHCWHQAVRVRVAEPGDNTGDVFVDTEKSREVYRKWLAMTRPADQYSPDGTRRPYWMLRPLKPAREFYRLPERSELKHV